MTKTKFKVGDRVNTPYLPGVISKIESDSLGVLVYRVDYHQKSEGWDWHYEEDGLRLVKTLQLSPGKFYLDRFNNKWCCYKIDMSLPEHCQAFCIEVKNDSVECFFIDGRYDLEGKREMTLVEEVSSDE